MGLVSFGHSLDLVVSNAYLNALALCVGYNNNDDDVFFES